MEYDHTPIRKAKIKHTDHIFLLLERLLLMTKSQLKQRCNPFEENNMYINDYCQEFCSCRAFERFRNSYGWRFFKIKLYVSNSHVYSQIWLDGHESEQTPGVGDGQGGLVCCSPWGCKESDMTERLNWTTDSQIIAPALSKNISFAYMTMP